MNKEQVEDLFNEMINCSGIVNLGANDIHEFKQAVNNMDGEKVFGTNEEVEKLLNKAIEIINERNEGKEFTHMLISLSISSAQTFMMEHMNGINNVLCNIGMDCRWQLATDEGLHGDDISIVIIMGY